MSNAAEKVHCVKPLKINWKPRQENPSSKIQLENPTRNPNTVNRQPFRWWSGFCTSDANFHLFKQQQQQQRQQQQQQKPNST